MKNTTIALFLLALTGNVFASTCDANKAHPTEEVKTEEELKKEMEEKAQPAK